MSETLFIFVLSTFSLVNVGVLGMVVKISRDLGKVCEKVDRHDKALKACPFCLDKEVDKHGAK